jgi:hypothetical protein
LIYLRWESSFSVDLGTIKCDIREFRGTSMTVLLEAGVSIVRARRDRLNDT